MDVITVFLNISLAYLPGYRLLFHILLQISELDRRAICAAVKHDDEQISLSTCKRGASVSRKRKTSRTFLHDSELAASCWSSRKDSLHPVEYEATLLPLSGTLKVSRGGCQRTPE